MNECCLLLEEEWPADFLPRLLECTRYTSDMYLFDCHYRDDDEVGILNLVSQIDVRLQGQKLGAGPQYL